MSATAIIKICGIKDTDTLEFTIRQGAELVGFVHFSKSPRHADLGTIKKLIKRAKGKTASVVLLVNPDWNLVKTIVDLGPDFIQLHGSESPEFVQRIITEHNQKVIKALPVGDAHDLEMVPAYVAAGAKILLDAKPPKNATRPGGLGGVFDWDILQALAPKTKFMLSGGLNVDNVAAAIKSTNAICVDVSSGVESAPGIKDLNKIKQFIANARQAQAS